MNGVLSQFDPKTLALLQTGLGMMQASGPSRTPVSFGQAFGQAGGQGLQAYQQQSLFNQKMAEEQRLAEERKKKEQALAQLASDPRMAQYGNLLQVAPQAAIDRAFPKPTEADSPFAKVSPKDYTPESVRNFSMTRNPADLVAVADPAKDDDLAVALRNAGVAPDSPQWRKAYEDRAKKLTTTSPLVQMAPEESAFQKKVGGEMGEQYAGLMRADMNAPASIGKYQRLGQLLTSVNTGKFKGTTTELKAAAKSIGIDLNAIGVGDDVAPSQAARALANQLALEMRNPAGGAGMPGALSDKDREFLIQSIPGLENDPGAIGTMIEYRVRLAKREQQVAKMARAYRKKNSGKFDEGFYDELQEWSNKNPLFPEGKVSSAIKLTPEVEAFMRANNIPIPGQ